MEETRYCASCDGSGTYHQKCRDCDDDGYRENVSCETCEGTGKNGGLFGNKDCSDCNGHGFLLDKCDRDGCDDGYIEVDCHEEDPHTWILYKCPECDYKIENRGDDAASEYALYQHKFRHERD